MLFDATIKTHMTCHCALRAHLHNPRREWNFAGEDFMHYMKVLMGSCMKGNSMAGATVKHMEKYVFALHTMFREFDRDLFIGSSTS